MCNVHISLRKGRRVSLYRVVEKCQTKKNILSTHVELPNSWVCVTGIALPPALCLKQHNVFSIKVINH